MNFVKMHGIGNDYIYFNCLEREIEDPEGLAVRLSDRHFGVGGDGIVLICRSDVADFAMKMFNSDGSQAEMCGNAIRCVGKYLYEKGLTRKANITIDTLSGIKKLNLKIKNDVVEIVEVNMGLPSLSPKVIPVLVEADSFVDQPIVVDNKKYRVTCVSMGNPHAVVYVDDLQSLDIQKIGTLFEHHSLFPQKINTEFVEIIDRSTVKMRVWERGTGETLACGTGACAVAVAGVVNNKNERLVTVELLGGALAINWNAADGCVYMSGTAHFVFEGRLLS